MISQPLPPLPLPLLLLVGAIWLCNQIDHTLQDHICYHDQNKGYEFQAVTRDSRNVYLIESDNLYRIPTDNIRPQKNRINVYDAKSKRSIKNRKWFTVSWLIQSIDPKFRSYQTLLYFEIFNEPFFKEFKIENSLVNDDSSLLHFVFKSPVKSNAFSLNKTVKPRSAESVQFTNALNSWLPDPANSRTIVDGVSTNKGYLVKKERQGRIVYVDLYDSIYSHFSNNSKTVSSYYLQITSGKAKFVSIDTNSDSKRDLVIGSIPFGFIDKTDLYLIDLAARVVHKMNFIRLTSNKETVNRKEVPVLKILIKSFFHCKFHPEGESTTTTISFYRDKKVFILQVVVGVLALVVLVGIIAIVTNKRCRKHSKHSRSARKKLRLERKVLNKSIRYRGTRYEKNEDNSTSDQPQQQVPPHRSKVRQSQHHALSGSESLHPRSHMASERHSSNTITAATTQSSLVNRSSARSSKRSSQVARPTTSTKINKQRSSNNTARPVCSSNAAPVGKMPRRSLLSESRSI